MLKTVEISRSTKTRGCAVTYRAGGDSVFGTCPSSCSLNPSGCGAEFPDIAYLDALLKAKPRAGESMTYSHFHPKWYRDRLAPDKTVINFSTDTYQDAVKWIKRGQPSVSVVSPDFWLKAQSFRRGGFDGVKLVRCPQEYLDGFSCLDCGDGKPLCARGDRDYAILFTGHGPGKRAAADTESQGGCYAAFHNVRRQWENTLNADQQLSDSQQLADFMRRISPRAVIRHHIAGDIGKAESGQYSAVSRISSDRLE